jgi:hypothetical protein
MNGEEFSGLAKKAGFNDSIVEALKSNLATVLHIVQA